MRRPNVYGAFSPHKWLQAWQCTALQTFYASFIVILFKLLCNTLIACLVLGFRKKKATLVLRQCTFIGWADLWVMPVVPIGTLPSFVFKKVSGFYISSSGKQKGSQRRSILNQLCPVVCRKVKHREKFIITPLLAGWAALMWGQSDKNEQA